MSRFPLFPLSVLVLCAATVAARADDTPKSALQEAVDALAAQTAPAKADDPWHVKFSSTWVSKYVGYLGPELTTTPAIQSELSIAGPSGWHVSAWWSTGLQETEAATKADQLDFMVGHTWKWGATSLAADLVYKDFIPLSMKEGDALVPRLRLTHDLDLGECGKLKPYLQTECWAVLPDYTRRPVAMAGVDYSVRLCGPLSLRAGASALFDYGTAVADRGWLFTSSVGIEYKLTDNVTLGAYIKEFGPHQLRDRRHEEVVSFALTINL